MMHNTYKEDGTYGLIYTVDGKIWVSTFDGASRVMMTHDLGANVYERLWEYIEPDSTIPYTIFTGSFSEALEQLRKFFKVYEHRFGYKLNSWQIIQVQPASQCVLKLPEASS